MPDMSGIDKEKLEKEMVDFLVMLYSDQTGLDWTYEVVEESNTTV